MLSTPTIQLENVSKIYGPHPERALAQLRAERDTPFNDQAYVVALNEVSLSVAPGSIHVIMGLSGSGKSTLLRCINRLVEPTAGRIRIEGEDITRADTKALRHVRSAKLGMVFQHFALLPHMTILENVAFGLRVSGVPKKERQDRAAQAIQLVGLQGWGDRKPRSLSGGMRQRVGLARALVMNTPVLLMDEPFSALDPLIREEMQQELLRLQKTLNKTIVFVTHDPNEAVVLGDRIAIMAKGQVVQEGDPLSIVLSPTNEYVRNFVRGVGIFKVLSASGVIDASVPSFRLGQDVHQHFAKSTGWTHMVALDAENRPIGVVDADTAARLSGVADPSRWRQALSRDFIAVTGSTLVAPLLSEVSLGVRPVLVVHESGNFLGVVTSNSVLQALAAFDSQTSAAVAQPEMTPKTKISHTI